MVRARWQPQEALQVQLELPVMLAVIQRLGALRRFKVLLEALAEVLERLLQQEQLAALGQARLVCRLVRLVLAVLPILPEAKVLLLLA